MNHYIYIDDNREDNTWFNQHLSRAEWYSYICRNYEQTIYFINFIRENDIDAHFFLDLDHDLGEIDDSLAPSGYDICKWVVENHIPLVGFHIHSMNPVGRENMRQLLTHYGYREI